MNFAVLIIRCTYWIYRYTVIFIANSERPSVTSPWRNSSISTNKLKCTRTSLLDARSQLRSIEQDKRKYRKTRRINSSQKMYVAENDWPVSCILARKKDGNDEHRLDTSSCTVAFMRKTHMLRKTRGFFVVLSARGTCSILQNESATWHGRKLRVRVAGGSSNFVAAAPSGATRLAPRPDTTQMIWVKVLVAPSAGHRTIIRARCTASRFDQ